MNDKKLCIGCIYYIQGVDKCRKFPIEEDYVGNKYNTCQDCREEESKCGKEAKYFEKYVSLRERFLQVRYEEMLRNIPTNYPETVNKSSGINGFFKRLFLQG